MPKIVDQTKVYWGVDPGKSGGIARYTPSLQEVMAWPMPESALDLRSILVPVPRLINFICIEQVHSSPQMGVASAFTFGRGYGRLEGLAFRFDRIQYVRPQVWLQGIKVPKRKPPTGTKLVPYKKGKKKGQLHEVKIGGETDNEWKKRLKRQAELLFPKYPITLQVADALLIAEYCRRIMGGN